MSPLEERHFEMGFDLHALFFQSEYADCFLVTKDSNNFAESPIRNYP
jgi:hypothetical protein